MVDRIDNFMLDLESSTPLTEEGGIRTDGGVLKFFSGGSEKTLTETVAVSNYENGEYTGTGLDNRTIVHNGGLYGVIMIAPASNTGYHRLHYHRMESWTITGGTYTYGNTTNQVQHSGTHPGGCTTFGFFDEGSFRVGASGNMNAPGVLYKWIVGRF
jgi:hypothetical protein